MRYSLLAGGKRIRPVLALATARAIGRDPVGVLPLAAAIELIHTYSLIHDDLPAMDDDDLRRGRPTCHVKFGEDVAILAGDGLYAEAFRHLLGEQAGEPALVLAAAARAGRRHRGRRDGRRAVPRRRRGGGDARGAAAPARAEDGPPDRRLRGLRTPAGRHGRDRDRPRGGASPPSSASSSRSSTTSSTSPAPTPRWASPAAATSAWASAPTSATSASTARATWPASAMSPRAPRCEQAAPTGAAELEQITDFILTRTA